MTDSGHALSRPPLRFSRAVRLLHLSLMLGVLIQLLSEQLMKVPKPGETIRPVEAVFLALHEWNGFAVLALAAFYLMYLSNNSEDWKRLFPWMSAAGCKGLCREIRFDLPGWLKGRLRPPTKAHHIAGTVHGLGILLAIGLGATGTLVFMGLESNGGMSADIRQLRSLHASLGNLMWIYLFGHAGMAIIHQLRGHRVLGEIFNLTAGGSGD